MSQDKKDVGSANGVSGVSKEDKESKVLAAPAVGEEANSLAILDGFECPCTSDLMVDPYIAADGISYEGTFIKEWVARGKRASPFSGDQLAHTVLTPNVHLKQAIQHFLKLRPTLASMKELEKTKRTAEDERRSLELAIQLREEQWAAKIAAKDVKDVKDAKVGEQKGIGGNADFFGNKPDLRASQEELGRAVCLFVADTQAYLVTQRDQVWDKNAAASFVGGAISSIAKGGDTYERLLLHPEQHSMPFHVADFIQKYISQHPQLKTFVQHPDFGRALKTSLYAGHYEELQKKYAGEQAPAKAASVHIVLGPPSAFK